VSQPILVEFISTLEFKILERKKICKCANSFRKYCIVDHDYGLDFKAKSNKKKNIGLPQVALNRPGHNTGGV
jgi:hypothetical protein